MTEDWNSLHNPSLTRDDFQPKRTDHRSPASISRVIPRSACTSRAGLFAEELRRVAARRRTNKCLGPWTGAPRERDLGQRTGDNSNSP
ncbi:hypothetical protein BaRGS_00029990 [Batillaria attramentaria]|uniref:Uncharacterized protein n=1 Tax=Batillaria attramentaria TaxID=370345 RepID=A0ABD0JVM0_9CAEN